MGELRIGSLCSGMGGLEMGAQSVLGGTTAWVSDIDKGACKILAHRFPGVPNIGDMTAADWATVEPVEVLCGGTPCQDLSHAGKRAGMTEGTRSNLWVAMREAIAAIRPSLVIWENVGGAYSAAADSDMERRAGLLGDRPGRPALRALGRVLGDLASLGYDASWHGLRAADVGAPHGRLRVFVVAYPAGDTRWLKHRDRGSAPDAKRGGRDGRTPVAGWGAVERAATQGAGEGALLPTPAVNDMGEGKTVEAWDAWTARMKAEHGNGNGHGASLSIEAQRLLGTPTARNAPRSERFRKGRSLAPCEVTEWGDYAAAIERWESLTRAAPAPTETGPHGSPRLSAAFSEWMMGLPDGWVTDVPGITRKEALRALGNGVVPQQAAAALREMFAWEVGAA